MSVCVYEMFNVTIISTFHILNKIKTVHSYQNMLQTLDPITFMSLVTSAEVGAGVICFIVKTE